MKSTDSESGGLGSDPSPAWADLSVQPLCTPFHGIQPQDVTVADPAWEAVMRVKGQDRTQHTGVSLIGICCLHVALHLTLFLFLIRKNAGADTNFPAFT